MLQMVCKSLELKIVCDGGSMKISFLFLIFFVSCSSQFVNPINMPKIETSSEYLKEVAAYSIFVQEVVDKRKEKKFLKISEMSYESHADIAPAVREALSQSLVQKGYPISSKPKVVFVIEVLNWNAKIEDNFLLSELKSNAELKLEVFEMQGGRVYSGKYLGESKLEKFSFSNESLTQVLGLAMGQAVDTLVNDKNLVSTLNNLFK